MKTIDARLEFKKAVKEIKKEVRFYDYHYFRENRIRIERKPEVIKVCDEINCDAGEDCIHQFEKRNIVFCVY